MLTLKSTKLTIGFHFFLTLLLVIQPITASGHVAYPRVSTTSLPASVPTNTDPIAVIDAIVFNGESRPEAGSEYVELIRASGETSTPVKIGDQLFEDDVVKTKGGVDVTLRFPNMNNGQENLIFLDENTEVEIGSLCLHSGWFLAQVGVNFQICWENKKLGVKTTEFEVSSTAEVPFKVKVVKGDVDEVDDPVDRFIGQPGQPGKPIPQSTPSRTSGRRIKRSLQDLLRLFLESGRTINAKNQLIVSKESEKGDIVPLPESDGKATIDKWSNKIVAAYQPKQNNKPNKNFDGNVLRSDKFKEARFNALWNGDGKSFVTIGEVYNDWGKGEKAKDVLEIAGTYPAVRSTPEDEAKYEANLGEAYLLTGNDEQAEVHLNRALAIKPTYALANYSKAKVLVNRYDRTGRKDKTILDEAGKYYNQSVDVKASGTPVNKSLGEADLGTKLTQLRLAFPINDESSASRSKPWCQDDPSKSLTYTGNLNLPTVKDLLYEISGPAELDIVGDRFTLASGSRTFTGKIVAATPGKRTGVKLSFDDEQLSRALRDSLVLTFKQEGDCNQLFFQSRSGDSYGTIQLVTRQ